MEVVGPGSHWVRHACVAPHMTSTSVDGRYVAKDNEMGAALLWTRSTRPAERPHHPLADPGTLLLQGRSA